MPFLYPSTSIQRHEAEQAASKHIFIIVTVYRSRRRFIIMLPGVRRHQTAACVAVVTSSCEGRICRPYSSSAVFSLTRPKLRTLRMLLIVKNLPKRLQPESADAIPLPAPVVRPESRQPKASRCNRTSIRPGSRGPKRAARSVRTRKAPEKRKAPRNGQAQKHALRHQIGRLDWTCQF